MKHFWTQDARHRDSRPATRAFVAVLAVAFLVSPAIAQSSQTLPNELTTRLGMTVNYPDNWSEGASDYADLVILQAVPRSARAEEARGAARLIIGKEVRQDHASALARLKEIEAEYNMPVTYVVMDGWPALERRFETEITLPKTVGPKKFVRVETVIAADNEVLRIYGLADVDDVQIADQMRAIARGVKCDVLGDPAAAARSLDSLRATPAPRATEPLPEGSAPPGEYGPGGQSMTSLDEMESQEDVGLIQRLQFGICNGGPNDRNACESNADCPSGACNLLTLDSEIEITASPDGRNVIVVNNGRDFASSNDGGATFPFRGIVPSEAGAGNGDPTIAYGASGTFYFGFIDFPGGNVCTTGIANSTNNGQTFNFLARATQCNDNCFPDQEHIAADRKNLSSTNQDQIYSVWRDFSGGGCGGSGTPAAGPEIPSIVCSSDGGQNWSAKVAMGGGSGAYSRVSVDQNGMVYAVFLQGNNIVVDKFSSCDTGLVQQGAPFPKVITSHNPVDCSNGVAGLDRCNGRNTLASTVIAPDDTDANHLYFAYASNTVAGVNEDILVRESFDGGANWSAAVRVNNGVNARRFMPWVCTVGGEAQVSWYDRRFAQPADNSLTDFYRGSAHNDGGGLTAGTEFRISTVSDSQCQAGWPSAVDNPNDSESCSIQPQQGGVCRGLCQGGFCSNNLTFACTANAQCTRSAPRCDFSDCGGENSGVGPNCNCDPTESEVCIRGRGAPKYGDYNGNACAAGRVYTAWAAAVSPPGINPPSQDIDLFFNQALVCCEPQIQISGPVEFGVTCTGNQLIEPLEVCNTGKEDLIVDDITSDNSEFSVNVPSAGWPLVISPDFCFTFQVAFDPVGIDSEFGTLTIVSNDPVNPNQDVDVSVTFGEPDIGTVIANSGSFGDVCVGDFLDLDLIINNAGICPLDVTDIASSASVFDVPSIIVFPLVVAPGGSVAVPIRFAPVVFGPAAATITIDSNDPDSPMSDVPVDGNAPPGDIRFSGSTDFGDVCAGTQAEKIVDICNVGECTLNVTSASIDCPDFTIINNPFPAPVSHDFCIDLTIRFTPTSAGQKMCTLTINSDDPDQPTVSLTLTGNTPLPMIDVPPDQTFPPTVLQDVAACQTGLPFPVSNTGTCPLEIANFEISSNPAEYSVSGLPSFPILLDPGHIAGDGALQNVFEPDVLDRNRLGTVSVTYVSEPILGTTDTIDRALCGEGVRTGARVLVTWGGIPLPEVKSIKLQRINANRNNDRLDTVGTSRNLMLRTVTPMAPCAPFQYHVEYSTVSNPIQLLPGSYQVTVQTRVDGKMRKKSVGFDVTSCEFNPTIKVDF